MRTRTWATSSAGTVRRKENEMGPAGAAQPCRSCAATHGGCSNRSSIGKHRTNPLSAGFGVCNFRLGANLGARVSPSASVSSVMEAKQFTKRMELNQLVEWSALRIPRRLFSCLDPVRAAGKLRF
jgi:hypothetical protein